jgi:hypothetical protein
VNNKLLLIYTKIIDKIALFIDYLMILFALLFYKRSNKMSDYQMCHLRLELKIYKKIKRLSINDKKNLSKVVNEILLNHFNNNKKVLKSKKDE